jgi:hypothetical protein
MEKVRVTIYADCNGAGAAYYRLLKKLDTKEFKLNPSIRNIWLHAPCDYNEVSFTGEEGGLFTNCFFSAEADDWQEENDADYYDNTDAESKYQVGSTLIDVHRYVVRAGDLGGK